jgi:hypothetical protein
MIVKNIPLIGMGGGGRLGKSGKGKGEVGDAPPLRGSARRSTEQEKTLNFEL